MLKSDPHQLKRQDWLAALLERAGIERVPWRPGVEPPGMGELRSTIRAGIYDPSAEWAGDYRVLDRHLIVDASFCSLADEKLPELLAAMADRFREKAAGRDPALFRRPPMPPHDVIVCQPVMIDRYPARVVLHYHSINLRWVAVIDAYLPEDLELCQE